MTCPCLNTLNYWSDVEALMYPELPKPGRRPTFTLSHADLLPWFKPRRLTQPDDHKYFVYFGLAQKKVLDAELFELFRTAPESDPGGVHTRPAAGKTFLCAMEITAAGSPVPATLQLAAFAVTFAEKKHGTRIGAPLILGALQDYIKNLHSEHATGLVDGDWFEPVTSFLFSELDWRPRELMAQQIYLQRVELLGKEGKPLRKPPEMDPINSFYMDDLERIRGAAERGPGAVQVQAYLAGMAAAGDRVDVTEAPAIDALLAAARFPAGRWPSAFPLFLMQQVAVNTALAGLADGGIFSVNGPPGTGKTTLLMDVIAARVVQRAELLATFARPETAFTKTPPIITYPPSRNGEIRTGPAFYIDERLLDCGIVVASENNKAVENITHDLPNREKVASHYLHINGAPFDYFAASAEAILLQEGDHQADSGEAENAERDDGIDQVKCWGLISVALGKKANRNKVAGKLGTYKPVPQPGDAGIQAALQQLPPERLNWTRARAHFMQARAEVSRLQGAIEQFDMLLPQWRSGVAALLPLSNEAEAADGHHAQALAAQALAGAHQRQTDEALVANLAERKQYGQDWPWWRLLLARLFQPAAHATTVVRRQELEQEYGTLRAARMTGKQTLQQASAALAAAVLRCRAAHAAAATQQQCVAQLAAALDALRAELGNAAFDPQEFAGWSAERQQKSLPRTNPAYQDARAAVFISALALQQAFISAAGKGFETNFRLALSMLAQDAHVQPHLPTLARHLWATFFLAVPVVSSTFASIARCFRDLGEGEIGLLLVDEAGQAVPSHALGAIWRAKRALLVGDPLQVEPVITMDVKLDHAIATYHGAPDEHLLTQQSAQHLADRGNRFGAHVRQYDGSDLWVGAPLRVHRRCVDPMFALSNGIAYNDKMVLGPDPRDEVAATASRPLYGPSRWIDIVADDFDDHFSVSEGAAARHIVQRYRQAGWCNQQDGLPDLFIISPFKSVATGVAAELREHSADWAGDANDDSVMAWLQARVGTVHTFQGKECESVIFILGGKTAGARSWAATRPNIINVAVTRAKRRLYVIGNRRAWAGTRFGLALAASMGHDAAAP